MLCSLVRRFDGTTLVLSLSVQALYEAIRVVPKNIEMLFIFRHVRYNHFHIVRARHVAFLTSPVRIA